MEKVITELPNVFPGLGEVKGSTFTFVKGNEHALIYSVTEGDKTHFEVFERKEAPLCLDFQKREYSETEAKIRYPRSNDFGKWAWTAMTAKSATERFKKICDFRQGKEIEE